MKIEHAYNPLRSTATEIITMFSTKRFIKSLKKQPTLFSQCRLDKRIFIEYLNNWSNSILKFLIYIALVFKLQFELSIKAADLRSIVLNFSNLRFLFISLFFSSILMYLCVVNIIDFIISFKIVIDFLVFLSNN